MGFFLFSFQLTPTFLLGTTLVISATVLYAQPDARASAFKDHQVKHRSSDAYSGGGTPNPTTGSAVKRVAQPGNVTPDLSAVTIEFPDMMCRRHGGRAVE